MNKIEIFNHLISIFISFHVFTAKKEIMSGEAPSTPPQNRRGLVCPGAPERPRPSNNEGQGQGQGGGPVKALFQNENKIDENK